MHTFNGLLKCFEQLTHSHYWSVVSLSGSTAHPLVLPTKQMEKQLLCIGTHRSSQSNELQSYFMREFIGLERGM